MPVTDCHNDDVMQLTTTDLQPNLIDDMRAVSPISPWLKAGEAERQQLNEKKYFDSVLPTHVFKTEIEQTMLFSLQLIFFQKRIFI